MPIVSVKRERVIHEDVCVAECDQCRKRTDAVDGRVEVEYPAGWLLMRRVIGPSSSRNEEVTTLSFCGWECVAEYAVMRTVPNYELVAV